MGKSGNTPRTRHGLGASPLEAFNRKTPGDFSEAHGRGDWYSRRSCERRDREISPERLHAGGTAIVFLTGYGSPTPSGKWNDFPHCYKPRSLHTNRSLLVIEPVSRLPVRIFRFAEQRPAPEKRIMKRRYCVNPGPETP